MECIVCGAELGETEAYCHLCGAAAPQQQRQRRCLNCGTPAAQRAKICLMCGRPVDELPIRGALWGSQWFAIVLGVVVIALVGFWALRTLAPVTSVGEKIEGEPVPTSSPVALLIATPTLIPTTTPTATSTVTPTPTPVYHTVAQGETLLYLAGQYGTTVADLLEANPDVQADTLRIGQLLLIPTSARAAPPEATPTPVVETTAYIIQEGDTLSGIALAHQTSVEAVQQSNSGVDLSVIQPGQEIIIPLPTPTSTNTPIPPPTATPTPGPRYEMPRPLYPPDGITLEADVIVLNWTTVDILRRYDYYVVEVLWPDGTSRQWLTQSSGQRLSREEYPVEGEVRWRVYVARRTTADGELTLQSPVSSFRSFYWKRSTPNPAPTLPSSES